MGTKKRHQGSTNPCSSSSSSFPCLRWPRHRRRPRSPVSSCSSSPSCPRRLRLTRTGLLPGSRELRRSTSKGRLMPWRAPWPERWSIKISLCDGDCRDATSLTCFLASFRAFFCSLVSPSMSPSPSTSIVTSPAGASDFLQGERAKRSLAPVVRTDTKFARRLTSSSSCPSCRRPFPP